MFENLQNTIRSAFNWGGVSTRQNLRDAAGNVLTRNATNGTRDMYRALGYPKTISFTDYARIYCRQDIAKRAIDALPNASWNDDVKIISEDNQTIEELMDDFSSRIRLYQNFNRIDKLSALGRYAVLLIGIDDGAPLQQPVGIVRSLDKIMYVTPFAEAAVEIGTIDKDPNSPRCGLPLNYKIDFGNHNKKEVHYTRVVHVAYDKLDSELYGTPRLQAIYNRLVDLEKLSGGGAEMFWLNARGGLWVNFDPEKGRLRITKEMLDDMNEELSNYVNQVSRVIRTANTNVQQLTNTVADPSKAIDSTLSLIASALSIPKRILMGSERGELSSSQDERAFCDTICSHRENHCEPNIIRPFIDKLINWEALPEADYKVQWTALGEPSAKERSENAQQMATAIAAYANSPFASTIISPKKFVEEVLGMEAEEDLIDDLMEQEGRAIDGDSE